MLYPALIRDVLLSLADAELYQPVWSDQILQELAVNLNARKPPPDVDRLLAEMSRSFQDACVDDYQHLIPQMTCDAKDRHVLALAVHAQAETIVTSNLVDFPDASTAPHGIVALSPDDFALELFHTSPTTVVRALKEQAERFRRPPTTLIALIQSLEHPQKLPQFAVHVCRYLGMTGQY